MSARTRVFPFFIFLPLLIVVGVGLYSMLRQNTVFVDAALEIGAGGFHREISLRDNIDPTTDFLGQIEPVLELLHILNLRYTIDGPTLPRLISRVKKVQKRTYSSVVVLTVEGSTEEEALKYLTEVINWVLVRHEFLYDERVARVNRYVRSLKRAVAQGSCLGNRPESLPRVYEKTSTLEIPWCVNQASGQRLATLSYLHGLINSFRFKKTEAILMPTTRNKHLL